MNKLTTSHLKPVVIVGAKRDGLAGNGKMSPKRVLPPLRRELELAGSSLTTYETVEAFDANANAHRNSVVVAVFRESDEEAYREARHIRKICSRIRAVMVHDEKTARMIDDKRLAHRTLGRVIPMPPLQRSGRAFSQESLGSSRPVHITAADDGVLDTARHNTQVIDTTWEHCGVSYYVSIRAVAVGGTMTGLFARCRPTSEGSLTVHGKNTPPDPAMLNALHRDVVEPLRSDITRICLRAGGILGRGFYVYDILPERGTGLVYVTEVGIKLADTTIVNQLAGVLHDLSYGDQELGKTFLERQARTFIDMYCHYSRFEIARSGFMAAFAQ